MVWLPLGSGRDIGAVDRLGFLGSWLFRCRTPDHEGWNPLDFLGVSRPNRNFSMGYAGFWRKKISRALLPLGGHRTGAGNLTVQKRSMAHRASLTHFLLFCNQLPSTEIVDSLIPSGPSFRTVCLRFVPDASRDCFCGFDDSNSSDRNGRKSLSILRGTGGDFQHSRQTQPSAGDHNEGSDSQLPFLLANNIEFDLDLRAITTFSPAKSLANFMRRLGEATQRQVILRPANAQHLIIGRYLPPNGEVIWTGTRER
jgi:hypothetical protein